MICEEHTSFTGMTAVSVSLMQKADKLLWPFGVALAGMMCDSSGKVFVQE